MKIESLSDIEEEEEAPLLELRFINSPPPTILVSSSITAEDGSPIAIELVDAASKTRVTSHSLSFSPLEIVVLHGGIAEEGWTTVDFNRNIVRQQDGKPPLLVGDLTVTLVNGVGVIGDVAFTDNSSWLRSNKFRLGAKMTQGGVVEAISKAFVCRQITYFRIPPPYSDPTVLRSLNMSKCGVTESSFAESVVTGSSFAESVVTDSFFAESVVTGSSFAESGATDSFFAESGVTESSFAESGATESFFAEGGVTESSFAGGNLSDQQLHCHSPVRVHKDSHEPPTVIVPTTASDFITPFPTHQLTGNRNSVSTDLKLAGPLDTSVESSSRFLTRSSKNLQQEDDSLSIGFKQSQSICVDDGPVSDATDVFAPVNTCVTVTASKGYDVVIRYGRAGIRNNDFISHLRAALSRRGISVHEDFDEVDAVPGCRLLIIFLTSTYVPSSLLNILERRRKETLVVYPIFYGISPSDLITNSKHYEILFFQDEPKRWQAALQEITQMPGYVLTDKSESELIDEIVRDVLKVLCFTDKEKMIGMDTQVEEILSLLCIESPDVRSIGIWGTVGVGKTAIAEEIFRRISVQYETCVFLKEFHKEVEVKGHNAVREDFFSKLLEVEPHDIRVSDIKTSFLKSRLQRKKVLIVLDDVNDFRDVETFLGKLNYFGPGSRIIITSRNRHVFVLCKTDHVYKVKPLDTSKSLLLLNRNTSKSLLLLDRNRLQTVFSREAYKTLSLELVKFSNGNPQVLQLFRMGSDITWDQLSRHAQKTPPIYIPGIFERSCCGLDDNERSIFLDIACFFRRMDKDDVAMLLDGCGFSAHVGFRSLVDKSLLTISHNMVDMLQFLQATGREIVRQESADRPGDRSRLWDTEDIQIVLVDDTGTSAIEGIFLDMSKLKFDANLNVFEKMCNLRLLKLYFSEAIENRGVSLPQGLEYLPSKLRLLHWEYYPISSLPQSFDPRNLVELNLPYSCVKKLWKGKKSLEKLKKMRLSYSYQLTKIPRLSRAPNLELLDLEGCNSLVSISQSICHLNKLVFLNLKDCSNLESVPSTVDLESLEVLNLSGCSKLDYFPEISTHVKELYMGGTMIQEIPPSIKNLVLLEKLDLENSIHLVNLPYSIYKLKRLETLNLSGCSSLEWYPDFSRKMKCLKSLDLSRTGIKDHEQNNPEQREKKTYKKEIGSMVLEALAGINNDLITRSWMASTRAYSTEHFYKEEEREIVFLAFRPSFSEEDWFAPENKSPFGETKMKRDQFPCMRSISNDAEASVNEAFLKNLEVLISSRTSFRDYVKTVVDSRKSQRIVFTGHSSGGATAILATVWYLETYFKKQSGGFPEPLCVTFGAPLVGDNVFKHALGRENWSRFFVNFITRFDIVPRIMLARKALTKDALPHVLCQLDPRAPIQENDQSISGFYTTVMKDTATLAYQAVCELIRNGDAFLESLSSFLDVSPYRPTGTFVFSAGNRLVSVSNSDAVLQILFYASECGNDHELSLVPYESIRDHRSYEEMVHSLAMKPLNHLELHPLPLDGDSALSDLGLSTRGRQCVRAAFDAEKQRGENQTKIHNKRPKIVEKLIWIEEAYKPRCRTHKNGYYDSFKDSNEEEDFKANVNRAELAGIFDEVLGLVKKGLVPDGFEGCREWIKLSTRYRRFFEPLDIANYHRHLKKEDTGPYMLKERPDRYKYAQRVYEHELLKAGRTAEEIKESDCGSCFWAEVEELRGKKYETVVERVKKLEWLLEGWIRDNEVDEEEIFLQRSTFSKWWNSLPEEHKRNSLLRVRMDETRAT